MKRIQVSFFVCAGLLLAALGSWFWGRFHARPLPAVPGTPAFLNKKGRTRNQFGPEIFSILNKAKAILLADKTKVGDGSTRLVALEMASEKIELVTVNGKHVSDPPGYTITAGKKNGVNTPYEVAHPPGYVVLGIKRGLKSHGVIQAVVYTPFNEGLNVPLLRQVGLKYLLSQIEKAKKDLGERKVVSQAYTGKLVSDVVPNDVALQLSLIEHIDPGRIKPGVLVEDLANEVLVTVACNGLSAYKYAVSKTGARGLFQFMPGTYKSLAKLYKSAELESDFVRGMDNHVNGAKASLLLFDSDLHYLKPERRVWIAKHPDAMGVYLAASYNCGAGHIEKAIQKYGEQWENHLNKETTAYVRKFKDVRSALIQ